MSNCMICNDSLRLPVVNKIFNCHVGHSCLTCFRDYLGLNNLPNSHGSFMCKCPKCPRLHSVSILNASTTYNIDILLMKKLDSNGCVNCPRCNNPQKNQTLLLHHIRNDCLERTIGCKVCYKQHKASFDCSKKVDIPAEPSIGRLDPTLPKKIAMMAKKNKGVIFEQENASFKMVDCSVCNKKLPEYSSWEQTDGSWKCHKCHIF